jgi:hypothetical protein
MIGATLASAPKGEPLPLAPPGGDFAKNTKAITNGFGRLVAHVIASRVPGIDEMGPAPDYPPVWKQIWPARTGMMWRSLNVIDDAAIDSIGFALSRFLKGVPWSPAK